MGLRSDHRSGNDAYGACLVKRATRIPAAVLMALLALLSPHAASTAAPQTSSQKSEASQEEKTVAVEVRGLQALDEDEVYEAIGVKLKSWFEFWGSDEKRLKVSLLDGLSDRLRGFLDSKGYYDATFTVERKGDTVLITIQEGRPVTVSEINISSDFPIRDLVTFSRGEPFETEKFVSIKSSIRKALLKEGFCSYDLETKAYVDLDRRSVSLLYRLAKGDPCFFGNTTVVKKPEDLSDDVILSRMRYRPGDRFSTERVRESYAALNQLGIFGQTLINTEIKYFNEVRPQVSAVYKQKMRRYTLMAGYDTRSGFRVRGAYDHFNFLGGGRKAGVVAQYSSEAVELSANFFQPAIWKLADYYYLDFYAKGGYTMHRYDTYDEDRFFLDAWLRHDDGRWLWDLGMALERISIELSAQDPAIIPGDFNLLYTYGRITYDARDSKTNPRKGWYLSGYGEYGVSQGELETNDYYLWTLEGRAIASMGKFTFAAVGKAGVLEDNGKAALPASKFFYAGGSFSNRAYGPLEIGRTLSPTRDDALGGRSWLNVTLEIQFPVWNDLYGGVFYDATMISDESYNFDAPWIQSVGVGVRYMTPVGPLKIDFGVNTHDASIWRASVMIGQSF